MITSTMEFLKNLLGPDGLNVLGYIYTTFAVGFGLTALAIVIRGVKS